MRLSALYALSRSRCMTSERELLALCHPSRALLTRLNRICSSLSHHSFVISSSTLALLIGQKLFGFAYDH
ncbi:hypothetical protein HUJ05_002330 [Dendroctonus ponderosae]|nr:hypothetical protein HUJ05_002330 [Dendroctonus ponderosae]